MSHTHKRESISDFSIERILSKETVASSVARVPSASSTFVANDKIDWLRSNLCKLQTAGSDGDGQRTEQRAQNDRFIVPNGLSRPPKTSVRVETAKRAADVDPTQISEELSWLRCTRYHPPKLPRKPCANKSLKRKPGIQPRIPFTKYQLDSLEEKYKRSAYLSRKDVVHLSEVLQLPQSRIKIWFQNRRARERRESQTFTQTQTSRS